MRWTSYEGKFALSSCKRAHTHIELEQPLGSSHPPCTNPWKAAPTLNSPLGKLKITLSPTGILAACWGPTLEDFISSHVPQDEVTLKLDPTPRVQHPHQTCCRRSSHPPLILPALSTSCRSSHPSLILPALSTSWRRSSHAPLILPALSTSCRRSSHPPLILPALSTSRRSSPLIAPALSTSKSISTAIFMLISTLLNRSVCQNQIWQICVFLYESSTCAPYEDHKPKKLNVKVPRARNAQFYSLILSKIVFCSPLLCSIDLVTVELVRLRPTILM